MAKEKSSKSSSGHGRPPFIDLLGLTFERLDSGEILVKLPMRDELIGNLETGTVHVLRIFCYLSPRSFTFAFWNR